MYNIHFTEKLGSVAGPLIEAERSVNASVRTELAGSMVTLGEPGGDEVSRDGNFACGIHPAVQIAIGEQQWVTGFHCM